MPAIHGVGGGEGGANSTFRPHTALDTICRLVLRNVVYGCLTLATLAAIGVFIGPGAVALQTPDRAVPVAVPDVAHRLLHAHRCWKGEAPADMVGVVPGHAVITVRGRTFYGGERAVGTALTDVFEQPDPDVTVHGFCR